MAYVIEYSRSYYLRKQQIRTTVLGVFAALLAVAAAVYSRVEQESKRVTFAEIVRNGTPAGIAKGDNFAAPGLQVSADRAFELQARWDELKSLHLSLMPYLRLWRVPVEVTDIVKSATAGFVRADVKELLVPVSFKVWYADTPRDWVGAKADRPMKLLATASWQTRRDYLPEEGDRIGEVATNLFGATLPGKYAPEVLAVTFAAEGVAGESVTVEFAFPSARRLPVSAELGDVTKKLRALHDELEILDLGLGASLSGDERTIIPLKNALGPRLRKIDDEYRRSMNPGAWLAEKFPVSEGFYGAETPAAERIFAKWDAVTDARLPWRRAKIRKIVNGRNYVNHRNLHAFIEALPQPGELATFGHFLQAECAPLSGAIEAFYFEAFDPAPASRTTIHATENLFTRAKGTGLFPTNKIAEKASQPLESLVVKFPTRYHLEGLRFPEDAFANATNYQFVFSQWNYDYVATNAPVPPGDVGKGLGAFIRAGYGYRPESVSLDFHKENVVGIHVAGLLPLRQEVAQLKGGAK